MQISNSGVWRILKRLELNRLPASQRYKRHDRRWKRYEKPLPGHRVQIDVKFIQPRPGAPKPKKYQFTAIDDCTRLRVLRIFPKLNQQTAIQFLDYVLERLPFRVEVIQTDNGVEFGTSFHWHVLDRGAGHVYIKPRTPRLNGKVKRSHRIDAEEFYRLLEGVVIDDAQVFNKCSKNGRTSTTTTALTAAWAARRPMKDSSNAPRPGRNRSPSVAHLHSRLAHERRRHRPAASTASDWHLRVHCCPQRIELRVESDGGCHPVHGWWYIAGLPRGRDSSGMPGNMTEVYSCSLDRTVGTEACMSFRYVADPSGRPAWAGLLPGAPRPFFLSRTEGEHARLFADTFTVLLSGDETEGQFGVFTAHCPVGDPIPTHAHAGTHEVFFIVEGKVRVYVQASDGEKTSRLPPRVPSAGRTWNPGWVMQLRTW